MLKVENIKGFQMATYKCHKKTYSARFEYSDILCSESNVIQYFKIVFTVFEKCPNHYKKR